MRVKHILDYFQKTYKVRFIQPCSFIHPDFMLILDYIQIKLRQLSSYDFNTYM